MIIKFRYYSLKNINSKKYLHKSLKGSKAVYRIKLLNIFFQAPTRSDAERTKGTRAESKWIWACPCFVLTGQSKTDNQSLHNITYHCHVGQWWTKWSPAATNYSGFARNMEKEKKHEHHWVQGGKMSNWSPWVTQILDNQLKHK